MSTPAAPAAAPIVSNGAAKPATQQADPGKAGPAAAPATPAEIKKWKLKVDGQEREYTESEMIERAQRAEASGKRFQEASEMSRKAQEIMKQADEDPAGFFSKRGKNIREWAENYLMEELKREQMSPEQKKAWENEEKLKLYAKKEKDEVENKRQSELAAKQKEHVENYNKLFVEALGKAGLPKTAYTVKRMAELQLVNLKQKLNLTADQLVKVVREDYIAEQKALFGGLEGDQLIEMFGPDLVKKLSKAQIAKLKAKGVGTRTATDNTVREESEDGRPPGMSDWRWYQYKNRRRTG